MGHGAADMGGKDTSIGETHNHKTGNMKVHLIALAGKKKCVGSKVGVISSTKKFDMSGCHKVEAISSSGDMTLHDLVKMGLMHNHGSADISGKDTSIGTMHNHKAGKAKIHDLVKMGLMHNHGAADISGKDTSIGTMHNHKTGNMKVHMLKKC